jgi:hypothetical protein
MARILLTWELGSGFGHAINLASIARALRARGHQVVAALQDPTCVAPLFGSIGVEVIATGRATGKANRRPSSIATYADMLCSVGFDSADTLGAVLEAWDNIYENVSPDVVVYDHSPFALLAARDRGFVKVQHGTGFCIPPDADPLPTLRPWLLKSRDDAVKREGKLLQSINSVLMHRKQRELGRLADLYYSTNENWLATYEELDHFAGRTCSNVASLADSRHDFRDTGKLAVATDCVIDNCYHGITPPPSGGVRPLWPRARGPKIFAYLQPDATTFPLVIALGKLGYPTIVRIAGYCGDQRIERYSASLKVVSDAIDLSQISHECDMAVLSGGHGTVATILLAGKPVVIVPIQLEQLMVARCCEKTGVGVGSPSVDIQYFAKAVTRVVADSSYQQTAERFAEKYRSLNYHDQLEAFASRIEELSTTR